MGRLRETKPSVSTKQSQPAEGGEYQTRIQQWHTPPLTFMVVGTPECRSYIFRSLRAFCNLDIDTMISGTYPENLQILKIMVQTDLVGAVFNRDLLSSVGTICV